RTTPINAVRVFVNASIASNYLELFWIVLIKERHGYAHHTLVIARNICGFRDLYCIVIVVSWKFLRIVRFVEDQILVPLFYINVCKPARRICGNNPVSVLVDPGLGSMQRVMLRHNKAR